MPYAVTVLLIPVAVSEGVTGREEASFQAPMHNNGVNEDCDDDRVVDIHLDFGTLADRACGYGSSSTREGPLEDSEQFSLLMSTMAKLSALDFEPRPVVLHPAL